MKRQKTAAAAATYGTQGAFAHALKVTAPTLSRLLKRDGWPVRTSPPWHQADVATVQRWRAESLREDRAALEHGRADPELRALKKAKLEQEIRKLTAQADTAEMEFQRERGELVVLGEVQAAYRGMIHDCKNAMRNEIPFLAAKVAGQPEEACERLVHDSFKAICDGLADAAGKVVDFSTPREASDETPPTMDPGRAPGLALASDPGQQN